MLMVGCQLDFYCLGLWHSFHTQFVFCHSKVTMGVEGEWRVAWQKYHIYSLIGCKSYFNYLATDCSQFGVIVTDYLGNYSMKFSEICYIDAS